MIINFKKLVDIRFHLSNLDSIQMDSFNGVKFNKEHYAKVLQERNKRGIPQCNKNVLIIREN